MSLTWLASLLLQLLLCLLCLLCLLWITALAKVGRTKAKTEYRLGPTSPEPAVPGRLAIIIPARDEVHNIGLCVRRALAQDHPDVHVVVLDDGSTDGTSEALAAMVAEAGERLHVLDGGDAPLPKGWKGKPWACARAWDHAEASLAPDWVLFIDADVRLHPHAASAAVAYCQAHELGMLSGVGRLVMETFWEKVMQPAVTGLIMSGNDLGKTNDPAKRSGPPLANGQFLLFWAASYTQIGGHEAVRDNVLDDVGLATAAVDAGVAYHLCFMFELFACRMYDSLGSLWEGWTKNLFAGMGHRWSVVALAVGFTLIGVLMPHAVLWAAVVGGFGLEWVALAGSAVLLHQLLRLRVDLIFKQNPWYGLSQPLASLMLVFLILNSALRTRSGTTTWKGRALGGGEGV